MGEMFGTLAKHYHEGGWMMHPILVSLFFAIGLIVDRAIALYFRTSIDKEVFLRDLKKHVYAGDLFKATILASSISEAMNCTAFGLLTAIPALVAFSVLQGRSQHMIEEINESSVAVLNLIVANKDKMKMPATLAAEE